MLFEALQLLLKQHENDQQ